jgi:glycosyltransferase involved in cell wall biosynthesis
VDISKFKPGNAHQNELRRRTGLDNDQILVGIVANLVPVKGHPTLIEAVAGLDNVHLFIAGRIDDPAYRVQLGDQAQDLHIANRIHFLGHIDDVPGFLHQMDIITLPTWDRWRREGCPVALLEAMACGKPCIATDIPGARDIIRDGINGLLIPPEDAGALSEALRRLSTHADVRKQLGKSARRTIVERYSIEKEVNAHEKFYTAILNH